MNKYLSQEFNDNILYLVIQKVFYPYEYMSEFEKFKEKLSSKERFFSLLKSKKTSVTKNINMFLKFGTNLKFDERLSRFVFKM